ncbi:RHS repeat domain-containing protein [Myceligenerans pegani]|uniref:Type IV secretion protein Rhs n=1 Tax=Myceligenerans pegani TaxID=2776917 RepID=A0ABR9N0W1_9MICO|nr:RHS repeat-associated core domain-containing protein [Myceligenerans sp. TRM 65318]MBE1876861.1 type IV secretion protein Rhs [Myceligenerans sp. TRM 65318]MBE3019132.1 type IV secretion protein Rhs [Myceligenerans sp. TRM 65318]
MTWRTSSDRRTVRRRWTATIPVTALVASLLVVAQAPQEAAADTPGGIAGMPSVPVVPDGAMDAPATDDTTSDALSGPQNPGSEVSDGGGRPTATPLSPSATWDVSEQTGDFTWSYPLRVPPVPGGLGPNLALSYASSAVDGRTSATNNQPSWVGDGWGLGESFVERTYGACMQDKEGSRGPENGFDNVGDLCWRSDNATSVFDGGGGLMIRAGGDRWTLKNDDYTRVQQLGSADGGQQDGEGWKITTTDGTQYFFGSRPASNSVWKVRVYGDDSGEPCYSAASFKASHCEQAWRWNLDKVVDRNGNTMLYDYTKETNRYGDFNDGDKAIAYDRGGWLNRIRYGLHETASSTPAATVEFGTANRCVPGIPATDCVTSPGKHQNWPDTPLDQLCEAATCAEKWSPTFWTGQRLDTVTTKVRKGGELVPVDRWQLEQSYPSPGDGTSGAALWLKSIEHTGLIGGGSGTTLPKVTFEGAQMANRVVTDNQTPLNRYRITSIVSEAGGVISVSYAPANCLDDAGRLPTPHTNDRRCYPATWADETHAEQTAWFNKYVVSGLVISDLISSSIEQQVQYRYDGAAWHYDTSEFTPPDKKNWNEFRGFSHVTTILGDPEDEAGPQTRTDTRYYRGMDQDRLNPQGGKRSVVFDDSEGDLHTDHDWLQGFERESVTRNGIADTSPIVTKTLTDPVWRGPTAARGDLKAYFVGTGTERTFTPTDSGGRVETRKVTTYDAYGQPATVDDRGDVSTPSDDLCTTTTYGANESAWLVSFPVRVQTVAVACGTTPSYPEHAVSDLKTRYDGQGDGVAPSKGNPTLVEMAVRYQGGTPVYEARSTSVYDVHGRVTRTADALDRATTTAYTPATGGPTTATVVTDPKGFATTTDLEVSDGQPVKVTDPNGLVTENVYDPLGRLVKVWGTDRPRSRYPDAPSATFDYAISRDAPSVVTARRLGPNASDARPKYIEARTIYDGNYRVRQEQAAAAGGGRLLTDHRYDSQGREYIVTNPFFNEDPVDSRLWRAADSESLGQNVTKYDAAGRPVEAEFQANTETEWETLTRYGGDRTYVTPPEGGTPTMTVTDARGRVTELYQFEGSTPAGDADITRYEYTPVGKLKTVTDPAGNEWDYDYDLSGQKVRSDDPSAGVTESVFDAAGQLVRTTDSRGQVLTYDYDALGRKTHVRDGSNADAVLARWTYDASRIVRPDGTVTVAKGKPTSALRLDAAGNTITSRVNSYTTTYQTKQTLLTIPRSEGILGSGNGGPRTYATEYTYNPDGSLESEILPAIGDLQQEQIFHTYDDAGRPALTYGGADGDGETTYYASCSTYTRLGEMQRVQLGGVPDLYDQENDCATEYDETRHRAWITTYYDQYTRRVDRTVVDGEVPRPEQADLAYEYDDAGNVLSITDTPGEQATDRQCFEYDHLRRLTEAWTPGGSCADERSVGALSGPASYWQSFTYDKSGNRLTKVDHGLKGDVTERYEYPDAGAQQANVVESAETVSADGTQIAAEAYDYDEAGNTIQRGGQRLAWDQLGRVKSVTEGGEVTSFVYGADGDRLIRHASDASTLYLPGQELRADKATGELTATRYYSHAGRQVAVRSDGALTWTASDHHGTAQVAINAVSMQTSVRRMDPFGVARGEQPAGWPSEKGFVGGTIDASTGLTHLGAREYDPGLGRFISVDPLMDSQDAQQMNGYAYSNNNPTSASDPDGMFFGWLFKAIQNLVKAVKAALKPKKWTAPRGGPGFGSGDRPLPPRTLSHRDSDQTRICPHDGDRLCFLREIDTGDRRNKWETSEEDFWNWDWDRLFQPDFKPCLARAGEECSWETGPVADVIIDIPLGGESSSNTSYKNPGTRDVWAEVYLVREMKYVEYVYFDGDGRVVSSVYKWVPTGRMAYQAAPSQGEPGAPRLN